MAEYIERGAAYEDFEKCNGKNPKWTPIRVKTLIARQKAADLAPVRHGRWELTGADKRGRGGNWKCTGRDGCGKSYPYKCDFCPNCGAKMDGGTQ